MPSATHSVIYGRLCVVETEVFKLNFFHFHISETRLYILLKLVQFTLNK